MNAPDKIHNELKEIRDMITRLDNITHNNILVLSKRIFESQLSITREVQEVLNLCLKLDNMEMNSHNLSRDLMKKQITGMNLNQSLWTKTLVGLSLLILATVVTCLYIVFDGAQLLELLAQKTQGILGRESTTKIVETPQSYSWYNNKLLLLGMGCICIFTIYGLSKISTYGLWDSILPASRKQFDKDSLDLQNKLNEINSDILRARQGAQARLDNMSNLADINNEQLRDIHTGLQDTNNKGLNEALSLLKASLNDFSHKVESLEEGASTQAQVLSMVTKELSGKTKDTLQIEMTPEKGEGSSRGIIKGTAFFRHQLRRGDGQDLGSRVVKGKGKDFDSGEGTSQKSLDDPDGSSTPLY